MTKVRIRKKNTLDSITYNYVILSHIVSTYNGRLFLVNEYSLKKERKFPFSL